MVHCGECTVSGMRACREEDAMNMPQYPLQEEQQQEIHKLLKLGNRANGRAVEEVRWKYARRRHAEFPGWLPRYNAELREYLSKL